MVRGGSVGLNHTKLIRNYPLIIVPHWSLVVRGTLVGLNHPALLKNYPMVIVSSGAEWFNDVR